MTQTWPSVEEMRRGIMLMLQGNPCFAWQYVAISSKGVSEQKYKPCWGLNQLTQFETDIFEGRMTAGFYSIRPDNLTLFGGLDFDNHDGRYSRDFWLPQARRAFDVLASKFPEAWFLESIDGTGGYHVLPFALNLMRSADMRSILRELAPEGVEIFPPQDKLTTGKRMGHLLRFPGKHQLKGGFSRFITTAGRIEDVGSIPPAAKWQPPSGDEQLFSLYVNVTRSLDLNGPEQRFIAMQRIVGRLKGKLLNGKPVDEEIAVEIHDRFYNENSEHIETPIEASRRYFIAWFRSAAPCNVEIPDYPPTPNQKAMIDALPKLSGIRPELLAATVRLFLSAKRYADEEGREMFLGLPYLARRLRVCIGTASNYRNACYRVGLIEMVTRGSSVSGLASTYKLGKEWES